MATWKFKQLGGAQRELELADWNAPHGRARQGSVCRLPIEARTSRTRYPGPGNNVTRHVFGPNFPDVTLKGRFRKGRVQAKLEEVRAFVADFQLVRVTWGKVFVCEGFIQQFDPGVEAANEFGATEVEWTMTIEVDGYPDLAKSRSSTKSKRKPTDYTSAIKAALLNVQADFGSLAFVGSIADLLTNALDKLVGAVESLTSMADGLADFKDSAFATAQRIRGAAKNVIRAGQELRELTESIPVEARQVGAEFDELESMTKTPATTEQIQAMLKEARDLDEAADRAIVGRTKATYVAKPGDTWESIAQQFKVSPDKLRQANLASPGEPVRAGQEYLIPG